MGALLDHTKGLKLLKRIILHQRLWLQIVFQIEFLLRAGLVLVVKIRSLKRYKIIIELRVKCKCAENMKATLF